MPGYPQVRLCVALSGGVDSTVLLAALVAGRARGVGLRAVHVNHGLHANSDAWSEHCRRFSAALEVPLASLTAQVGRARGVSLEATAREARYALLAATLTPGEFLLTAHHEDDQVETVLLQLFRGAGLAGLAAMPGLAPFGGGWLARPLLPCTRAQLQDWARRSSLSWIEDDTNADERLDRNYLRRRILPLVRERWKGVGSAVSRSARHAAEGQRLLDMLARKDADLAGCGTELSVQVLRTLPLDRRRNALRFWISRTGRPVPDTRRLDELAGPLLEARPDAHPMVRWGDTLVQRHADLLWIRPKEQPLEMSSGASGRDPGSARAPRAGRLAPTAWSWRASQFIVLPGERGKLELKPDPHGPVNLDALPDTVMIRWREGGERIRPRRGGPRRALKSLLQEARLPITLRANLPLIFADANLLAVGEMWLDESIQATPGTAHRGRLHWKPAVK
ncbi:MAG TPA: tRNA lysidine(34) synthetase TilS [Steroidobacteraceae bacterium]|nr:tRNA lysidine(34) synthetase TilS [Steroidobacteraceae bacterium]